jgi:hypothetical protein
VYIWAVQAFGTKAIAERVYPTPWPSKPQRFAVLRALRTIKLPGTWMIAPAGSGRHEMVLFDSGNADSAREKAAIDRDVAKERRSTREALRYRRELASIFVDGSRA